MRSHDNARASINGHNHRYQRNDNYGPGLYPAAAVILMLTALTCLVPSASSFTNPNAMGLRLLIHSHDKSHSTHSPSTTNISSRLSMNTRNNYIEIEDSPDHSENTVLEEIRKSSLSKTIQKYKAKLSKKENPETGRWLRWMTGGTPRGVADIKMRDPVAFGGLPRSDRYASRDWFHNTINLPKSAILQSIRSPVLFMTFWGLLISIVHRRLGADLASHICIPSTPHSLMVSALGLLLVFRTNSAYQRFAEGRKIWEEILSTARDLSRLAKLYEPQIGSAKLRRVQRLLAAFPYLLRFRIRPNSIMKRLDDPNVVRDPDNSLILYQDHATSDSDSEAAAVASLEERTGMSRRKPRELYFVDKRTLPWRLLPSAAMEECARAQNRPLWVCDRMAKELHSVPDAIDFTARERLTLLSKVDSLSRAIGACERIHQTVVPLNYARHALRSLTMWLLSLPFALVKDLGLMTGPVLFVISWMLFGVYEIGYSIEDPFQGTLRLSILCDAIRRDVLGEEIIRNTAFTLNVNDSTSEDETEERDSQDEDEDDNDEDVSVEIEDIVIDSMGNIAENIQSDEENLSLSTDEVVPLNGEEANMLSPLAKSSGERDSVIGDTKLPVSP